jgi:hypothetical protein
MTVGAKFGGHYSRALKIGKTIGNHEDPRSTSSGDFVKRTIVASSRSTTTLGRRIHAFCQLS